MKTDRKGKNREKLRSYFYWIVDAWSYNDKYGLEFIRTKTINDYYNGVLTYNQSTVILETITKCLLLIEREKYDD